MMNDFTKNTLKYGYRAKKLYGTGWLLLLIYHSSVAQIGTWQSHASYRSGQSVAVVGNYVYAATQNGFFYYDQSTNETRILGKTTGLSDVGISRLLYLADQQRLLVAYQNGNLDFLTLSATGEPGAVTNSNTIRTASALPASRTINHVNRVGNYAYLSTDFGLIVLDLLKNEIRDTYFSQRADGTPLPILQTTVTTDSLYALTAPLRLTATGNQLRAIRFAPNVNIADPANWRNLVVPGAATESIVTNQGRLSVTVNQQGIYERQSGQWALKQVLPNILIRQFPTSSGVILATDKTITLPNGGIFSGPASINPRDVITDGSRVWVADALNGLLISNSTTLQLVAPEGPARDQFANLYTYPQTLVALPNGPQSTTALQPPIDVLSIPDQRWASGLVSSTSIGFNSAVYLPAEQRLYLGNFGQGLWSQVANQPFTAVTLPSTVSPFISSLATDLDGNLWIATGGATGSANLHVRRPNGQFQSFSLVNRVVITQIVPDDDGFLWLRLDAGNGLLVVDPQQSRSRFLNTISGQGNLLSNTVRSLVKDQTGAIWVGTDLGPRVFDNPAGAFDGAIDAQAPLISGRRLLASDIVTAITVDGGNRKWLGTQTGLYRVSPDGSQLLNAFTAGNSPLPNNQIQALAIEPISGKLFIQSGSSDRTYGLVSYQGIATEPADALSQLTIFPNPVRPDFTGSVGINGLTDNATVKILDAGGQLVYETRSQGGTATWNLVDYRGRRAQTGIYLVVVVQADGLEGLAGKLAVVR